jgi:arsenical pump membrane protein
MTIAYGSILSNTTNMNLIYSTIIGSNIGAILSPVGALAGIMWIRILKQNNVEYGFTKFIKNGSIITLALLIAGSLALLII